MAKWQRDTKKERYWRRMLKRWQRSRLTVREFCAEVGLAEHNFFAWKRVIAERDRAAPRRPRISRMSRAKRRAADFVAVHVVPDPAESAIEIVYGVHVLRVRRGFDRDTLMQVLALLAGEGQGC